MDEEGACAIKEMRDVFVDPGQDFELRLHLGFQGGELCLVAALALFGHSLMREARVIF